YILLVMSRLTNLLQLSSLKLTIILLVLLVLLLLATGMVSIQANPQLYSAIKAKFLKQETSTIDISNQDGHVTMKIKVIKKDEALADSFFQKLGINRSALDEVSFDFDNPSEQLNNFLPLKLNVFFNSNKLSFATQSFVSLSTALGVKEYNFASDSAALHYKTN